LWTLHQQDRRPDMLVFVDDGSEPEFAPLLQEMLDRACTLPFRLIRHPVNKGLAAARNTGLRLVETDYVVNLDSDDLARNDFIATYVRLLDADQDTAVVSCFLDTFDDGRDWRSHTEIRPEEYRPQGRGMALAQVENCLGHANSAYRTEELRS